MVEERLQKANEILSKIDRPFGHRVAQGIIKYVQVYPNITDPKHGKKFIDEALSDQFGQKIISKLKGLPLEDRVKTVLDELYNEVICKIDDPILQSAYESAYKHDGYSFNWKGLSYDIDQPDKSDH